VVGLRSGGLRHGRGRHTVDAGLDCQLMCRGDLGEGCLGFGRKIHRPFVESRRSHFEILHYELLQEVRGSLYGYQDGRTAQKVQRLC